MFGGVAVAVNCWLSTEGLVHCLKLTDTVVALLDYERATQLRDQLSTLKDSGCRAILISQAKSDISGMEKLENLMNKYKNEKTQPQVEILPEDDCTIFFTSGTTGLPKAVLSTQRMFLTNLFTLGVAARRATLRRGEDLPVLSPDDPQKVLLLPVPLFHVTGEHIALTVREGRSQADLRLPMIRYHLSPHACDSHGC
jgi:acyl-CoA synthetase (AMP-forming)/AMP-acid ligase II